MQEGGRRATEGSVGRESTPTRRIANMRVAPSSLVCNWALKIGDAFSDL